MIWLSILLTLSLSDDRHSTKASCALNFISTFLLKDIRPLIRSAVIELNELTDNFDSHNALRNGINYDTFRNVKNLHYNLMI